MFRLGLKVLVLERPKKDDMVLLDRGSILRPGEKGGAKKNKERIERGYD